MTRLLAALRRFASDEDGAFAIIFGVMAIVLVALGGAVVDFASIQQARTRAQVALDAAALALQPRILETPAPSAESLRAIAEQMLIERLADASIGARVDAAQIDIAGGSLDLSASLTIPMHFVSLVGVERMQAGLVAQATRKRLNLEVAMVLDNSSSMASSSRMTNLISAAKSATEILFEYKTTLPNVFIGVVPFTLLVNVGPGNANALWMDRGRAGSQFLSNNNFDQDDDDTTVFGGPVDRIALMNQLTNTGWLGCVEARRTPLDTDDTPPDGSNPATLFTPLFAPDEPDSGYRNSYLPDSPPSCNRSGTCVWTEVKRQCTSYDDCAGGTTNSYAFSGVMNPPPSCACPAGWSSDTGTGNFVTENGTLTYTRERTCLNVFQPTGLSPRELQERICKYPGAAASGISQPNARGPNADCPANPITPLTNIKQTVIDAIDAMAPQGGTNIHEGTAWGFRVLSPGEPFTQGKSYDAATAKVMIVMTDGDNTAFKDASMNGASYYSAYGFPYNERLGTTAWSDAQLEAEMNRRMLDTCTNAKAAGITIYTIGLSSTVQSSIDMLKACASSPTHAYFPAAATELDGVFQHIALQLADLRLAR